MHPFNMTTGWKDQAKVLDKKVRTKSLRDATIRDFGGGWNVVDSELDLSMRFQVLSDNVSREEDGSIGLRYGTELLADLAVTLGAAHIINIFYFADQVVVVASDGNVYGAYADGTVYLIANEWFTALAGGTIDFASFAVFKGDLLICNGINKPLKLTVVDPAAATLVLDGGFLLHPTTAVNANVPVARYITVRDQYVVMANSATSGAGDIFGTSVVHISSKGAAGVWAADAGAENTAVSVDLGEVGVSGDQNITGLNTFRDKLVVGFLNAIVLGTLDIYPDDTLPTDHVPDFSDVIDSIGCHSHRCMINTGTDLLMVDQIGAASLARSLFSASVEPKRVSELIDPAIARNISQLEFLDMVLDAHAVYNGREKQVMMFFPNHSQTAETVRLAEDALFIDIDDPNILHVNWPSHNTLVGDQFTLAGATGFNNYGSSHLNGTWTVARVMDDDNVTIQPAVASDPANPAQFGGGTVLDVTPLFTETRGYIFTNIRELKIKSWSRYRGWKWRASTQTELSNVVFADDKRLFLYGNSNNRIYRDFEGTGDATNIEWVVEFPWIDFNDRFKQKASRYIMLDTAGDGQFEVMMFVDNLYKRRGALIPNNIMTMYGGESGGFGVGPQPYGGGMSTSDQRLTAWTARFKIAKLRLQGSADRPVRIVSIGMAYQTGDIRR